MSRNSIARFGIVILALFVGYGIGKRDVPVVDNLEPFKKNTEINYKGKYLSVKTHLEQINEREVEEFLELSGQKEKYNKANEIIGKILMISIAEIGLKLSPEAQGFAAGMINNPEKYSYRESQKEPNKK